MPQITISNHQLQEVDILKKYKSSIPSAIASLHLII